MRDRFCRNATRALTLVVLLGGSLHGSPARADAESGMHFKGYPPLDHPHDGARPEHPSSANVLGNIWSVFGDGLIEAESASRLERYLKAHHIPDGATLYLNSQGGSLAAAFALGKVLKKHQMTGTVGTEPEKADPDNDPRLQQQPFLTARPGVCYNACLFALVGAPSRAVDDRSHLAISRFVSWPRDGLGTDDSQRLYTMTARYLDDAGVSRALLDEAAADTGEIHIISKSRAEALRVINDRSARPDWSADAGGPAPALRGERLASSGTQKLFLYCAAPGEIALGAIFEARGASRDVARMTDISLLADKHQYPLTRVSTRIDDDGRVSMVAALTQDQIYAIQRSLRIGLVYQQAFYQQERVGIINMDFSEGMMPFDDLILSCGA